MITYQHSLASKHIADSILPVNRRLRMYNQYPGCYENFKAMEDDLERIASMGFKQVWVNPFYLPCQENFVDAKKILCPYAMKDHRSVNPEFANSFDDVISYTQKAKDLNLVPLFDFVALHVAIDHPFVWEDDPELLKHGVETTKWFKRHPNGNILIKGMDENYVPTSQNPYSDTAAFDYDNPKSRAEIIEHFFKPFIKHNIATLGFMGARLDAVGRIPRDVHEELLNYIDSVCQETHQTQAYLVAETVGSQFIQKDINAIKGLATHTMNSAFWMPGPEGQDDHHYQEWQNDNNWYAQAKGQLQYAAPTAGHSGSHDEERYVEILEHKGIHDPIVLKQRMLEKIMQAAFSSDGGHILAYGDEFGVRKRINLHQRSVVDRNTETLFDLSNDIKAINEILRVLPPPVYPEWTQRVFVNEYPELVIFIVHQGEGFTGASHLIIGNSYNDEDKGIIINQDMIDRIMKANGRNFSAESQKAPNTVYLCGKVSASLDVRHDVIEATSDSKNAKYKAKL